MSGSSLSLCGARPRTAPSRSSSTKQQPKGLARSSSIAPPRPTLGQPTAPARVQQWKNSLLDLSLRNRLINYTDRAGVKLRVPEGRLGELEDLVSAGRAIALRPLDQIEEVDASTRRAVGCRAAR